MSAKAVFELEVEPRHNLGKGASRRLRRLENRVPAIIYGDHKQAQAITLDHKKVMHALENQAFYSHILTLNFKDGSPAEQVVLKDLQRHHFKKALHHLDFQRVSATEEMHLHVPLRFVGESSCPGVKAGGIVNHHFIDVEVRCLAKLLPEYIEVDLSVLGLEQSIHLSQLSLPAGVHLVALSHGSSSAEHDQAVVSVHLPRQTAEPEANAVAAVTEVMPKGKEANPATASAAGAAKDGAKAKDTKDKAKGK